MITACPLSLKEANEFVDQLHRHHDPVYRDKYRVGAIHDNKLVGVVQVGRPVSRMLDDGKTVEVTRLCTDGTKNVCSFLYSRAARIAKELGYSKIITYILETESGDSLVASGWKLEDAKCGGATGIVKVDLEQLQHHNVTSNDGAKFFRSRGDTYCNV